MTEPKIVHLPPREKNPPREPNETWDAGERLFGLEELLLHMPPIRKLHLERGKLKDLVRAHHGHQIPNHVVHVARRQRSLFGNQFRHFLRIDHFPEFHQTGIIKFLSFLVGKRCLIRFVN